MKGISSKIARIVVVGALALPILQLGPAALAKGGGVTRQGSCSGTSTWKLKLSPDNGRIEVDFEVDQNRAGDTWAVRMKDNGVLFFSGQRVTQAPSDSFEVRKFTKNRAGADNIVAKATNQRTGEVCRGTATL
jgi:hypothetical protein